MRLQARERGSSLVGPAGPQDQTVRAPRPDNLHADGKAFAIEAAWGTRRRMAGKVEGVRKRAPPEPAPLPYPVGIIAPDVKCGDAELRRQKKIVLREQEIDACTEFPSHRLRLQVCRVGPQPTLPHFGESRIEDLPLVCVEASVECGDGGPKEDREGIVRIVEDRVDRIEARAQVLERTGCATHGVGGLLLDSGIAEVGAVGDAKPFGAVLHCRKVVIGRLRGADRVARIGFRQNAHHQRCIARIARDRPD